jgi:hypothetical protein
MLTALKRRRNRPPSRHAIRHWRLAKRFRSGRAVDRRRPAATIFRHDGRPNYQVSHHLTVRPLTFAPLFKLAFVAHVQAAQLSESRTAQRGDELVRRSQLLTASRDASERIQLVSRTGIRLAAERPPALISVTGVVALQPGASSVPAIREVVESVIERVTRNHLRIESRQRIAAVTREQPSVAAEVERALSSVKRRAAGSPVEMPAIGMGWPARNGLDARIAPDLDTLTDQIVRRIDDRLTAQRERMGRF